MRTPKTLIASLLIAGTALASTGCASAKFSPKALAEYADKNDAEEYDDAEEWGEDVAICINPYVQIGEDGAYICLKGDDIEEAMDGYFNYNAYYRDSIKEAVLYYAGNIDANYIVMSLAFSSSGQALDAYDEYVVAALMSNSSGRYTDGESEDKGVKWYIISQETDNYYCSAEGVYLQGNTVFIVYGYGEELDDVNDRLDDICDEFDLTPPSEL